MCTLFYSSRFLVHKHLGKTHTYIRKKHVTHLVLSDFENCHVHVLESKDLLFTLTNKWICTFLTWSLNNPTKNNCTMFVTWHAIFHKAMQNRQWICALWILSYFGLKLANLKTSTNLCTTSKIALHINNYKPTTTMISHSQF